MYIKDFEKQLKKLNNRLFIKPIRKGLASIRLREAGEWQKCGNVMYREDLHLMSIPYPRIYNCKMDNFLQKVGSKEIPHRSIKQVMHLLKKNNYI